MNNNQKLVFAGGWPQLQHAKHAETFDEATFNTILAISWKPDGTKFWVSNQDNSSQENIIEYNAVTPHSTTGAIKVSSLNTTSVESQPRGIWWSRGGDRLYFIGQISMAVHQIPADTLYSLADMDIVDAVSFPLTEPSFVTGVYLNVGESKMYVSDRNNHKIYEYNLNTPKVLSSIVFSGDEFNIPNTNEVSDVFFKPDLSMMFVSEFTTNVSASIRRYILREKGKVITALFVDFVSVFEMEEQPQGLFIREHDGMRLYVVGSQMNKVFTYIMSLDTNNTRITRQGHERVTRAGEPLVNR